MPLRDHFHPPLGDQASWEELHGAWPTTIAFRLNAILPLGYRSGVRVHLGTAVELDVAAFERDHARDSAAPSNGDTTLSWAPASPALLLETDELTPPEYEVRVYDEHHARRLVAAVEIVSPRNKDRPESRDAFVTKCQALLQQEVCVAIVDPVTERSANLYAELAARLGAAPPAIAAASIYAVSCRGIAARGRWRVEAWEHELAVGTPLPTLPLWLTETLYVPLELELTYEDTCRNLRIA
jgi:hypothetical protein